MAIRTTTYIAKESVIHSVSAGLKIVALFAYSVCLFLVDTWVGMALFAAFAFGAAAATKISVKDFLLPLIPVYVIMFFTIALNWLLPGLFYALRIFLLTFASLIVCYTSTPEDLTAAFKTALSPLKPVRVPVDDICTTLALSLRFMPLLASEVQSVRDAQWARGAAFDDSSPVAKISAWSHVFIPVFVGLFRKADKLAVAMDARCYGHPAGRTALEGKPARKAETAVVLGVVALLILASALL